MSLSGMVEIAHPVKMSQVMRQAKSKFVMPANAGIQVCFRFKHRLDSGLRRNDETKSRLPVGKFRTFRLGAEDCSVQERLQRRAVAM